MTGIPNKTHRDYLPQIGNTFATIESHRDRCWNQYYDLAYSHVVKHMMGGYKGTVLDVGTSHGYWLPFLKKQGFTKILGVELDPERARIAKSSGYDEVYNCDAAKIPHKSASLDVAISIDVFVHILQIKDKTAVLNEVERLLKPGGICIFNHTISRAYGYSGYHIEKYCSFLSLHELIKLVQQNPRFLVRDIKPTYYNFRNIKMDLYSKLLRKFITLPFIPKLMFLADYKNTRNLQIEESDTVFIKLEKVKLHY